jgi:hypothetical protein
MRQSRAAEAQNTFNGRAPRLRDPVEAGEATRCTRKQAREEALQAEKPETGKRSKGG